MPEDGVSLGVGLPAAELPVNALAEADGLHRQAALTQVVLDRLDVGPDVQAGQVLVELLARQAGGHDRVERVEARIVVGEQLGPPAAIQLRARQRRQDRRLKMRDPFLVNVVAQSGELLGGPARIDDERAPDHDAVSVEDMDRFIVGLCRVVLIDAGEGLVRDAFESEQHIFKPDAGPLLDQLGMANDGVSSAFHSPADAQALGLDPVGNLVLPAGVEHEVVVDEGDVRGRRRADFVEDASGAHLPDPAPVELPDATEVAPVWAAAARRDRRIGSVPQP